MGVPEWFCKKCGHCCKHQYTRMEIYHDEIHLFTKGSYIPYIGYGDSKSNVNTLIYKLIAKRCPLYDDDIGCTVYEDRPIICQKFPFSSDLNGLGLDNSCKNSPKGQDTKIITGETMQTMMPILKKVQDQSNIVAEKFYISKLWLYKNFKWKLITQKKLLHLQITKITQILLYPLLFFVAKTVHI